MHHQMQKIAASLALGALELDMLIRGGLSRGQLIHNQAVVIGKALIEAYELESETAVFARVAASNNIELSGRISFESDGLRCLDYMTELMLQAEERFGDARTWATEIIRRIDLRLPHMNDRQAAKWQGCRARLDHQRITWPTQS
jgi:hypothetical protein